MAAMEKTRSVLTLTGRFINESISFFVFSILDLVDFVLCFLYKVADLFFEAEWKPCYCSSSKEVITNSGKILVSEQGESKIVSLSSTKLRLEEISDTLYTRPSLLSEVSKLTTARELARRGGSNVVRSSSFTVNSAVVEILEGKIGGKICHPIPRWSDCDCKFCTSWTSSCKETLYVRAQVPKDHVPREDVLFIHGFISSSAFWTETVFPNLSKAAKSKFRFFAIDLLGFGRSPKPADSMYTLREHLEMIEQSVLEAHKVKSFHIVAHSLGCILALALAVKHPNSIKSLTLLAPVQQVIDSSVLPKGEQATQHVMRMVAPRRVWPAIAFGSSIACWYEHISRTICLLICKNHRFIEFVAKLVTRNRMRMFLLEGFFCHTHNAAWHTLHNIICGTAGKMDSYLDIVRDQIKCDVNVFHGRNDDVIPIECSYNVQARVPHARVKVIEKKDHITIVVGRQKAFTKDLEAIWKNASSG